MNSPLSTCVIGASGYAGAELVRLLSAHPHFSLAALAAHSKAGEPLVSLLPNLRRELLSLDHEEFLDTGDPRLSECDVAFLALPHGASAAVARPLVEAGVFVVDLSADFRLDDRETYETWYGKHGAESLFDKATYGLVEYNRDALQHASLIAVPGCYPTASILAVAPALEAGLVEGSGIIIDAKSGVSGAGRKAKTSTHYCSAAEGIKAYGAGGTHRHTPEIEEKLSRIANVDARVSFVPHLVPMKRGILVSSYLRPTQVRPLPELQEALMDAAQSRYGSSPLVDVVDELPDTAWVSGSACAHVSYRVDERAGVVQAFCSIDNLLKGAAAQAIQGANVRFGFDESTGLSASTIFP